MVNFIDEPVSINITRMRAIAGLENFFEGQADFYPEIEIDGRALGGQAGFKIEGDNDVFPNGRWTFNNTVSQRFVPIRIKILEADSASGDDIVDINPIGGENVLNLTYDLLTREVKDESGTVLGTDNQEITLRGNNRRINGEISFKISGLAGPEADNRLIKQDSSPTRNNFFGQDVAAGDFDNDGIDDLVTVFGKSVQIQKGTSNGLERQSQVFTPLSSGILRNNGKVAVGDLDGDGTDEIVFANPSSDFSLATILTYAEGTDDFRLFDSFLRDPNFAATSVSDVAIGDFDGNGNAEVAVGDSAARINGNNRAGAVQISDPIDGNNRLGAPQQLLDRDTPGISGRSEAGTRFGEALATGDFNGDGFDDLVVGASGARDNQPNAGAVHILFGSSSGLSGNRSVTLAQSFTGVADRSGDRFGAALAVGDFNNDSVDDLAVGAPGRNAGQGQVYIYRGDRSSSVITPRLERIISRQTLQSSNKNGARFGDSLAAKDINNDNFADLVIGAPGEDRAQGAAHVVFGGSSGLGVTTDFFRRPLLFRQSSLTGGVAGNIDDFDRFGASLAIGNFDGSGGTEVAIGVPNEDIGNLNNIGVVNIVSPVG